MGTQVTKDIDHETPVADSGHGANEYEQAWAELDAGDLKGEAKKKPKSRAQAAAEIARAQRDQADAEAYLAEWNTPEPETAKD